MRKVFFLLPFFFPLIALAQNKTPQVISDIFFGFSVGNLAGLIPALIAVALVTFLSGVVVFVGAGGDEEKRQNGRQVMIFGLIVLFVMIAFWGIVGLITKEFFGTSPKTPNYLPNFL